MINWRLHQLMSERRCTNNELAQVLGVHSNTVARWHRTNEMPSINGTSLNIICETLDCTPSDLIEYTPKTKGENQGVGVLNTFMDAIERLEKEIKRIKQDLEVLQKV